MSRTFSLEDWRNVMPSTFDEQQAYAQELSQLVERMRDICIAHQIPFVVAVCPAQTETSAMLVSSHYLPADLGRIPAEILACIPPGPLDETWIEALENLSLANDIRCTSFVVAIAESKKATKQ